MESPIPLYPTDCPPPYEAVMGQRALSQVSVIMDEYCYFFIFYAHKWHCGDILCVCQGNNVRPTRCRAVRRTSDVDSVQWRR